MQEDDELVSDKHFYEHHQSFDLAESQRNTRGRRAPDVGVLCVVLLLVFVYLLFFAIYLLFGFHNNVTIHKHE